MPELLWRLKMSAAIHRHNFHDIQATTASYLPASSHYQIESLFFRWQGTGYDGGGRCFDK